MSNQEPAMTTNPMPYTREEFRERFPMGKREWAKPTEDEMNRIIATVYAYAPGTDPVPAALAPSPGGGGTVRPHGVGRWASGRGSRGVSPAP